MGEQARWTVEFYIDVRGRNPVQEFLDSLPQRERAVLFRVLALLQEFGLALAMPHARPVEGGLWELRAGMGRIFYFAHTGRRFILLHGYRKKGRKAPRREIEVALSRWHDLLEREQ